ncbi:hypothetical protein ACGGZK_16060 [Agromyces sp. MMS24-K17]|uniref:hypothetical protein n=1 Tax=Agromyces sp. MMS24-K17 TaxID=3372850 RepID=UPI0037550F24
MRRRRTARLLLVAALAAIAGVALGSTVQSTVAAWIDRGGSKMAITAVAEPPPPLGEPVVPGAGTTFPPPAWSGSGSTPNPTPTNGCFTIVINTTSATPVAWQVVLHTAMPPFDNRAPFTGLQGTFFGDGQPYEFTPAADYATSGDYLMTPVLPTQYASATVAYTARVCFVNTPEPAWQPPGPTTYTQLSPLTLVRNGSTPCVSGAVQGHSPFYVGFTLAFNWKTLLDEHLAAQTITQAEYDQWLTYVHWDGGAPGVPEAAFGATGTDYEVTLQGYSVAGRTVASYANVTIGSCAY